MRGIILRRSASTIDMTKTNGIFAYAKVNMSITDDVSLEPNDVGLIESQNGQEFTIFFIRIWKKITLAQNKFVTFNVQETGDAFPKKICNICHKLLETTKFAKNQNGKNNRSVRRPSCTDCRKILEGTNMKPSVKKEWLKSKPVNVPFECPICRKKTIAGVTSKVVLDHNHLTGDGRAWICDSCNTGIGRFKDDVALLQRAIKFLG